MTGRGRALEVDGTGRRVALVVARYNDDVTTALADGARAALEGAGVAADDIPVYEVPGAFELAPTARQVVALVPDLDAVVALGAVVRGETPHFDFVAAAAARGLQDLASDVDVPVIFGVLTTDTREQALERARADGLDKGGEAARTALAQVALYDRLKDTPRARVRGFRLS